jgi:long-chain acyl-CoA synthetase
LTFGWVPALVKAFSPAPVRSVPVGSDPAHRVDPKFKGKLIEVPASSGGTTLYELSVFAFQRYGSKNCMGSRKFLGWKDPRTKEFEKGTINWLSFSDVGTKAHKFGAALKAKGMVAAPPTTDLKACKTPCRMAIFENTCAEWMIAALGAFTQGITVVTVYATLGKDAVAEAVQDNTVPVIVCNQKDVPSLVEKCRSMNCLKVIVYTKDLVGPNEVLAMPAAPRGVTIISFDEFVESGNTTAYPPTPPTPDSTAVVMYTSGSTGKPSTYRYLICCR